MHSVTLMGAGILAFSGLVYFKRNTLQNPGQMKTLSLVGLAAGAAVTAFGASMDNQPSYF